ncbi:putative calcium calmodulin-dependent protein kinase type 1b protein [Rosellinia necatrix]|uniref:mitogen-activated protein kinase n=1 Tax=Rosellinia necatrix TaxID=77044 RepID=A0A1W2TVN3_ROSNE|nr:putative calcium calmodulin-dependent protein kinase type 1b protein [Rosellinia necatrix]
MAPERLSTSEIYILSNNWSGARLILGSPNSRELSMVDMADCDDGSQWMLRETGHAGYYRLHTVKAGTSKAADVLNDRDTESRHVVLAETGDYSGQFWRVDAWGDGFYRISNLFTGEGKHLDVYSDTHGPHLAPGNCIGQHWTLAVHQAVHQVTHEPSALSSTPVQYLSLDTSVDTDGVTQHTYMYSEPDSSGQALRTTEDWRQSRLLGRGSFGSVWLEACVSGPKQGHLRAVKEVKKQDISSDSVVDYERELQAVAEFSHRRYSHRFVQSSGWWDDELSVYIAMEYLHLGDLQQFLGEPLPEDDTRQITRQVVEGLNCMHEGRFAHRDLKPQNILVARGRPDWWVKIADFGLSKRVEGDTALRTRVFAVAYAAPEVLGILTRDDFNLPSGTIDEYSIAVDIWSLGSVVYRMKAGQAVFEDCQQLSQFMAREIPLPKERLLSRGASVGCINFLESCLVVSPSQRPTTDQLGKDAWLCESPLLY